MRIAAGIVLIASLSAGASAVNIVQNGDFEDNSAGTTQFNVNNGVFGVFMAGGAAFGGSNELDIVTSTDFGIEAYSGKWKVGLHQNTGNDSNRDEFSLTLTQAVTAGQAIKVSFATVGLPGSPIGGIEIGLSNNASDFGTLIFGGNSGTSTAWKVFTFEGVAPADGSFLTVRNSLERDVYAFVDAVSLEVVPAPASLGAVVGGAALLGRRRRA